MVRIIIKKILLFTVFFMLFSTSIFPSTFGAENKPIKEISTEMTPRQTEAIQSLKNSLRPDNTSQNWSWAVNAGGYNRDYGNGIAVDANGNIYITGYFEQDSAVFGNTMLYSQGYADVFVAKLDTNGVWQWATSAGGTDEDEGFGIAVDANGNTYITGHFDYWVTFGNTTITSQGSEDVFVAKLNMNGAWLWATRGGGTSYDHACNIVVDANGDVFITGSFNGSATFGTTITSEGELDPFLAKLNADGAWQWAISAGGPDDDEGLGVAVDANGDVSITGCFCDSVTFGTTTLTSCGIWDVYVAKLSTNGTYQWATRAGGTACDQGSGITVDANGDIYITGFFDSPATFGNTTLTNQGLADVFVAKLSATGAWRGAISAGGTNDDYPYDIAVDANENTYITGTFINPIMFDNITLTSNGWVDLFVAKTNKLKLPLYIEDVQATPPVQSQGEYVNITATITDNNPIQEVHLIIDYNNTSEEIPITENVTINTYYCNRTYSDLGLYLFHLWANDTAGNTASSFNYTFIIDNPPFPPNNPCPANGATNIPPTATLNWTGGDPDNDTVTYDVYLGTTSPLLLIASNHTSASFNPGTLEYSTTYYWKIVAWDAQGVSTAGPIWQFTTILDTTPPITTISFNGTMGNNGWYISPVAISFNATDSQSGATAIYYNIDDSGWSTFINPFVISNDGTHTISYYSIDKIGNVEAPKIASIQIDQTPPTITLTKQQIDLFDIKFIAEISDNTSGIDRVEFYLDGVLQLNDSQSPFEWNWSGLGAHTVIAKAYDRAGNSKSQSMSTPLVQLLGFKGKQISQQLMNIILNKQQRLL